ncbi:MAG TPA: DUF3090 domain-containing protein [Levilinea sp.]|nr:DUF3090 domain-containing protein [Levilinea sp.]
MAAIEIDVDPVIHITTDAIGKPGQRVFYIQAWQDDRTVSLIVEKIQIQTLAIGVEQFLSEIKERYPHLDETPSDFDEPRMRIQPPVDPLFRVGELGLAYDSDRDRLVLVAREVVTDEQDPKENRVVRFWCTRAQIRAMTRWGLEVSGRGRPICAYCGEPIELEGHFCPKRNGHKN